MAYQKGSLVAEVLSSLLNVLRHTLSQLESNTLISVRHPQSNGQVERVNSTMVPVLQANMTNERNWDKTLLEVESQLSNSQNKTVGNTPFRILYGYHASFREGVQRHITVEEEYEDVAKL